MPRFFIDETGLSAECITVKGSDALHIGRSLRMRVGDDIVFCREGTDFLCTITQITAETVTCRINERKPVSAEPTMSLTIYQALPKKDKPELIIQKVTELGASRVVFFISNRCVSRPDEKSAEKKLLRYRKIAEEAAKQSGRGIIPQVDGLMSLSEALEDIKKSELKLICYENGGKRLSEMELHTVKSCAVMIGAEGGFEHSEVNEAVEAGCVPIWLGERILRCETCPIAVTAVIMNLSGNF